MAAFVQGTGAFSNGSVASIALAFAGGNVVSGNDIIVGSGELGPWDITFTDNNADAYTEDISLSDGGISSGLAHTFDATGGATTVTATPDASDYLVIGISEFSGVDSYDTGDTSVDGWTTSITANFTTNFADVCVSLCVLPYSLGVWVSGPGGYSIIHEGDSGGNNMGISFYYKIQGAAGAEAPTYEWTNDGKASISAGGYQQASAPPAGGITVLTTAYMLKSKQEQDGEHIPGMI